MRLKAVIAAAWLCSVCACSGRAGSIEEARDLVARAKTLHFEAGSALAQGDPAAWKSKVEESRRLLRSAARQYREAGADESDTVAIVAEYAESLELSRDYDLAAEAYDRCASLAPEVSQWHLKRGQCLLEMGPSHHREAKSSLERVISLAPGGADASRASGALGQIYFEAGHYDLAEEFARPAVEAFPEDVAVAGLLVSVLVRRGAMPEAEQLLTGLKSFRGDELNRLQTRVAEALVAFDQNRGWFEDSAAYHLAYGRLLTRVGRFSDAALALKRAGQLSPADTAVWNMLGGVNRRLGDLEGARAAYTQSLAADPDQPSIRKSLEGLESSNQANPNV